MNLHVPDAGILHVGRTATAKHPRRTARAHHDWAWRYLSDRYRGTRHLPVRIAPRLALAARRVLAYRVRAVAAGARLAMPRGHRGDEPMPR